MVSEALLRFKDQNLRNRFRVRITVGKTPEAKADNKTFKPKAFFKTYNEAYEALVKYHENPNDIDKFISVKNCMRIGAKNILKH